MTHVRPSPHGSRQQVCCATPILSQAQIQLLMVPRRLCPCVTVPIHPSRTGPGGSPTWLWLTSHDGSRVCGKLLHRISLQNIENCEINSNNMWYSCDAWEHIKWVKKGNLCYGLTKELRPEDSETQCTLSMFPPLHMGSLSGSPIFGRGPLHQQNLKLLKFP